MAPAKTSTVIHSNHTFSALVSDGVVRAAALLALMGIAVLHLVQLVPTFQATPLLGGAFIILILSTLAVGARLLNFRLTGARLWLPIAGLGVSSIAGYAFTRVASTPLDNQDLNNWSCTLGMAALFVESAVVALSLYAISGLPRHHSAAPTLGALKTASEPFGELVRTGQSNGSRV
jgi:hypothetical protein